MPDPTERATLAAGCFWDIEHAFRQLRGVSDTRCGYTGGVKDNPTYEDVCGGRTGHAEAVEVIFDPNETSYAELLAAFWDVHNPALSPGAQYRSAIFYHDDGQRKTAMASMAAHQKSMLQPIVTLIEPAREFWPAEEHHQRYIEKQAMIATGGSGELPAHSGR